MIEELLILEKYQSILEQYVLHQYVAFSHFIMKEMGITEDLSKAWLESDFVKPVIDSLKTFDLTDPIKHLDLSKILTLDRYALRLGEKNPNEVVEITEKWRANFSITTIKSLKVKRDYDENVLLVYEKRLESETKCRLDVNNEFGSKIFKEFSEKELIPGDITNRFLNLFETELKYNDYCRMDALKPDIDRLNIFLEEFLFPPIEIEENIHKDNIKMRAIVKQGKVSIEFRVSWYKDLSNLFLPFSSMIRSSIST